MGLGGQTTTALGIYFAESRARCGTPGKVGWIKWLAQIASSLIAEIVKALRRRADHDVALGPDLEHSEAALDQSLRGEAEQPVNAGEAIWVEDRLGREGRAALATGKHGRERCGVVAKRGEPRRLAAIGGSVALLEIAACLGRRGGEPATVERRLVAEVGLIPQPAAEQPRSLGVEPGRRQRARDSL